MNVPKEYYNGKWSIYKYIEKLILSDDWVSSALNVVACYIESQLFAKKRSIEVIQVSHHCVKSQASSSIPQVEKD